MDLLLGRVRLGLEQGIDALYNLPAGERAILAQTMPAQVYEQWVPVDWKAQWAPMAPFFRDL